MHWITLERESKVPLIRQIYSQLRQRVLSGSLPSGTRLPSSRDLARQLGVSRNVVLEAFDLLYSEGFTESRHGSGTYIADGACYPQSPKGPRPEVSPVSMGYDCPPEVINFKSGTPDLSEFPFRTWIRMLKSVFAGEQEEVLAYGHPEGRKELREAICEYVVNQRGVVCHPEQIVITAGTTQAIGIASSLLLSERRQVVLEDPITLDIQSIVKHFGGTIHPVPVDDNGLETDRLPAELKPAFVYVTPSHQFPTGGTLPIQRRIALLEYTRKTGAYIIEDDYDSEFRFDGPPISSLHGLCPERVIYIGTFSKTLCPAIRIGYIILPPELIALGRSRKWHSDLHNEVSSQLALAAFIGEGHYLRHVSKMKKIYRRRRQVVETELRRAFGAQTEILGSSTGLHLAVRVRGVAFTDKLLAELEGAGARFYSVEMHAMVPGRFEDCLLVGYGNLEEEEIRRGIGILAEIVGRQGR